jgi:hypothetical protein
LLELVRADAWDLANDSCRRYVRSVEWTTEQVATVLLQLTPGNFRKVFGEADSDYGTHVADDYLMWVNMETLQCSDESDMDAHLHYLKLAIDTNEEGIACLVIGIHRSRP